jgi:hypothetical protein
MAYFFFGGVNRLESEADHLPSSSDEITNVWSFTSTRSYVSMLYAYA